MVEVVASAELVELVVKAVLAAVQLPMARPELSVAKPATVERSQYRQWARAQSLPMVRSLSVALAVMAVSVVIPPKLPVEKAATAELAVTVELSNFQPAQAASSPLVRKL
jgi:hypothetical protein